MSDWFVKYINNNDAKNNWTKIGQANAWDYFCFLQNSEAKNLQKNLILTVFLKL